MSPIINALSEDITGIMTAAADQAKIPLRLALGCAIAESHLNPYAERWGKLTDQAKDCIAREDWDGLGLIINQVLTISPDISFGYGQQIVRYHALGDHTETVANCLAVREMTFRDPAGNLQDMAKRLAGYLKLAMGKDLTPVNGDPLLGACAIYNHGHWPEGPDAAKVAAEWKGLQPNLDNYRKGLSDAAAILAQGPGPVPDPQPAPPEGVRAMTIPETITAMQETSDRLGNGGSPYSPLVTTQGVDENGNPVTLAFQAFWFGYMNEYPTVDGGRDVIVLPYPTLTPEQLAQFQGLPA